LSQAKTVGNPHHFVTWLGHSVYVPQYVCLNPERPIARTYDGLDPHCAVYHDSRERAAQSAKCRVKNWRRMMALWTAFSPSSVMQINDCWVDHPRSGVMHNFGRVCRARLSVSLYVWQTITSERLDTGSSCLHIRYIFRDYGSSSYMKVFGSRSRSQKQKGWKYLFPQCKTSIDNNSCFIKPRDIKFACHNLPVCFWQTDRQTDGRNCLRNTVRCITCSRTR